MMFIRRLSVSDDLLICAGPLQMLFIGRYTPAFVIPKACGEVARFRRPAVINSGEERVGGTHGLLGRDYKSGQGSVSGMLTSSSFRGGVGTGAMLESMAVGYIGGRLIGRTRIACSSRPAPK